MLSLLGTAALLGEPLMGQQNKCSLAYKLAERQQQGYNKPNNKTFLVTLALWVAIYVYPQTAAALRQSGLP
jgi:hypothetical protein